VKAVILAAGLGARLRRDEPKCLLRFGAETLLQRHLRILHSFGIHEVCIGVGHGAALIEAALAKAPQRQSIELVYNPDFAQGSIITLWTLREMLSAGEEVLLTDADVLYDDRLISRLLASAHPNCFLLDREFEAGPEPVKLCVRDTVLVEFRKRVEAVYDYCGESVGFFRLSGELAKELARTAQRYVDEGRSDQPYEEALRDVLLARPARFGFEDITGLPWIEIDFPQDVRRAHDEILPRLLD
jgi:choline kinase